MKCVLVLAALSVVAFADYGVPAASDAATAYQPPQVGYGNPVATSYGQQQPLPPVLPYGNRRHHHHSDSSSNDNDGECRVLKAKCLDNANGDCTKPKIYNDDGETIIKCRAKDGEFVQLVNQDNDLIAYGFELLVQGTCKRDKWRVGSDKVKAKSVSCQYYPLPDVINAKEFQESRTGDFKLADFLNKKKIADIIDYITSAVTADAKLKDDASFKAAFESLKAVMLPAAK